MLKKISILYSVNSIGHHAFSDCKSLKEVSISPLVTKINEFTFTNCKSLTQIYIPSSVTVINYCAFMECTSLSQIQLPSSLTKIGFSSFEKCSSLTQIIKGEFIPENVEERRKYLQKYESDDKEQLLKSLGFENKNEITQIALDSFPNIKQQITNILEGQQADEKVIFNILITMANEITCLLLKGLHFYITK